MVDIVYDKAVHNIERVSIVDSTRTTDFYCSCTTGSTAVLDNIDAGSLTLQSLEGRTYRHVVHIFSAYGRDRAGDIALALHTVADHHHFVKGCGGLFHIHVNGFAPVHFYFYWFITHA